MDKTSVFGILGVFATTCVFVLGAIALGLDEDSTPLIATVLSTGGLITVQLLAGQRTNHKVDVVEGKVDRVLNGEFDGKIQDVLIETLSDDVIDPAHRNGNVTES